jgi:hypothetical protein
MSAHQLIRCRDHGFKSCGNARRQQLPSVVRADASLKTAQRVGDTLCAADRRAHRRGGCAAVEPVRVPGATPGPRSLATPVLRLNVAALGSAQGIVGRKLSIAAATPRRPHAVQLAVPSAIARCGRYRAASRFERPATLSTPIAREPDGSPSLGRERHLNGCQAHRERRVCVAGGTTCLADTAP